MAKYLQRIQPARLIGLSGLPGVVSRSCGLLDHALINRLAHSFGVDSIVHTVSAGLVDVVQGDHLLGCLESSDVSPPAGLLREQLANLKLDDGFPIGRFIYDTTLRSELLPTIERIDAPLRRWTADCLRLYRWIQGLIEAQTGAPITFVTGHLDYNPWGLTGEAVRRAGGEVLWFRLESNVPLLRINADVPGTLNRAYHQIEAEWFNTVMWPLRKRLAANVDEFVRQSASGVLHQRWTAVGTAALSTSTADAAAVALRSSYGWTRADLVVGIFAHAMSDQPLADEQAYADRFQWLAETLSFAARHPERCWIVKLHPRDAAFDGTGSTNGLEHRYSRLPHIRFIRAPTATGLMEALCDCAVTLFGAPGLNFAVAGRPVIVAGGGPYADCGFVHRAENRAHYEALLIADLQTLQPGPEQVERARLYAYAARVVGAASSPLLDSITTAATETYWELAESRLRHHATGSDDLYESIRHLIISGERRSGNPNLDRFCRSVETSAPSTSVDPLPLLGSEPLRFCAGEAGSAALLKGFDGPDLYSAWAIEATVLVGFRLSSPPTGESVRLQLNYCSIGSEPDWPRPKASIFADRYCLVDRALLEQTGTVDFDVPASAVTDDNIIVLSVLVDNLGVPAVMGLSPDKRTLGIGLITMVRLD